MSNKSRDYLNIVVPCYNEEKNLEKFYQEVMGEIEYIKEKINANITYSLIFINDGSQDNTLGVLQSLRERDCNIGVLDFSRNFGKEAAILAGLQESERILTSLGGGDGATILIDADLQDPISFIHLMYKSFFDDKYDMVCARRINRSGEGFFRAFCGDIFYRILNFIGEVSVSSGMRDFRLLSYDALGAILQIQEYHRFSKAMFEWIGYKKKILEYEYIARKEGESGWGFWKLFRYAIEGFVSFSTTPLRLAFILGFLASFLSICYGGYIAIDTLIYGNEVKGYPSLVCIITFFGGLQLIVLGIIGEYIARIYEQVKNRPHYFLRKDRNEK